MRDDRRRVNVDVVPILDKVIDEDPTDLISGQAGIHCHGLIDLERTHCWLVQV